MKIETEPQENRTLKLTVEVDEERVQPALRAAARRISKDYRIPGFRPGKAPYETILRQLGESAVYQAALEDLSQKVYQEALEQENIEPYAPGELEDVQLKPMVLKFTVPLPPEIELGDYRANLRVPFEPPTVTDEALQENLENLREHQSVQEPVDRPAQLGDSVTLDVKAFLNEGENPSDFLITDENVAVVLDEKADWPMAGFAPHIVGMSAGEERKFDLAFEETYANESLRGQVAHFEVKAKEVKARTLPEWNDDLARSIGDYESLDDLRAKVRAQLQAVADRSVEREYADKVVEQLVSTATVTFPPVLLEHELDDYMADLDRRLREQRLTIDDYAKVENKTKEQLREELRPQAETRLKRSLALGKVVALEGLVVTPEEVEARVDALSAPWGERAGEMRKVLASEESRRMLSVDVLTDKGLSRLMAIAKGEDVPAPQPLDEPERAALAESLAPASEAAPAEEPAAATENTESAPAGEPAEASS